MESVPAHMSCVLKLNFTPGWEKSVTKVLQSVHGVTCYINKMQGLAYVSGKADPYGLLALLAKSGQHAELLQLDYGYQTNQRLAHAWTAHHEQQSPMPPVVATNKAALPSAPPLTDPQTCGNCSIM